LLIETVYLPTDVHPSIVSSFAETTAVTLNHSANHASGRHSLSGFHSFVLKTNCEWCEYISVCTSGHRLHL